MKHEPSPGRRLQDNALRSKQPFFGAQKKDSFFGGTGLVQKKAASAGTAAQPSAKAGTGNVQAAMSRAFGTDFSSVRVHENSSSATAMGALAYARGNDVHFAPGQLNPATRDGQQLIGHEFTHVLQQRAGMVQNGVQAKGLIVNNSRQLEDAADRNGERIAAGEQPLISDIGSPETGNTGNQGNNIVQGYFAHTDDAGTPFRVADDMSAATKDNNPWHGLYAESGKAAASTKILNSTGAKVELYEPGEEKEFKISDTQEMKLKRVAVKNLVNKTEGDVMDLYADCGRSNSLIVGSLTRSAAFNDKDSKPAVTTQSNPELMKYEIMINHFSSLIANSGTILNTVKTQIAAKDNALKELKPYIDELNTRTEDLNKLQADFNMAKKAYDDFIIVYNTADEAGKKAKEAEKQDLLTKLNEAKDAYGKKQQELQDYKKNTIDPATGLSVETLLSNYFTEKKAYDLLVAEIMKPYNDLDAVARDNFDKKAGINTYANPSVGSGYTMSSGGTPYPGKSTWNFHWGGVVMESNDKKDKVVLENYSVSKWDAENNDWDLKMYGTMKKEQTFHEAHKGTQQHGQAPTTMEIKKQ